MVRPVAWPTLTLKISILVHKYCILATTVLLPKNRDLKIASGKTTKKSLHSVRKRNLQQNAVSDQDSMLRYRAFLASFFHAEKSRPSGLTS